MEASAAGAQREHSSITYHRTGSALLDRSMAPACVPLPTPCFSLACRGRLSNRPGPSDQLQISVDAGNQFDLDAEIDGLRGQLGRLKQVRVQSCPMAQIHALDLLYALGV